MTLSPNEIQQLATAIAEHLAGRPTTEKMVDGDGAAEILACSRPTIERLTRDDEIPSFKFGRLRRYLPSELLSCKSKEGDRMSHRDPLSAPVPVSAIASDADLQLDLAQHGRCAPKCVCCGDQQNRAADDGQLNCELCRGCYVDALPKADD